MKVDFTTQLPQKAENMKRITRQEFCDNMDSILETISREDKGIILTEEGKHDLVVCPASWFDFHFDDDFGSMLIFAVRYALGNGPSTAADYVIKYIPVLDDNTIAAMINDIGEACKEPAKLVRLQEWNALYLDLIQEQNKRQSMTASASLDANKSLSEDAVDNNNN